MTETSAEVASRVLAAALSRRLGADFQLVEGHPAGGTADVLWFLNTRSEQPQVHLDRAGSISVSGDPGHRIADHGICQQLADGSA